MAGLMEQVCVRAWVLLWRWLCKHCRMSYHQSAIPGTFYRPSYNILTMCYSVVSRRSFMMNRWVQNIEGERSTWKFILIVVILDTW
jgi:hypothetical protein